jgi:hypothetical protein
LFISVFLSSASRDACLSAADHDQVTGQAADAKAFG